MLAYSIINTIIYIALLVGIIYISIFLISNLTTSDLDKYNKKAKKKAINILKERLDKGEINKETYDKMRNHISSKSNV
ncbi:MAG: SHOCT domain-containing protein [Patescibacteria group bacterium]